MNKIQIKYSLTLAIMVFGMCHLTKAQQVLTKVEGGASWKEFLTTGVSAHLGQAIISDVVGGATLFNDFDTLAGVFELYDIGNDYDPSTGLYTVPSNGYYAVNFRFKVETSGSIGTDPEINIYVTRHRGAMTHHQTLVKEVLTTLGQAVVVSGRSAFQAQTGDVIFIEFLGVPGTGSGATARIDIGSANIRESHFDVVKLGE